MYYHSCNRPLHACLSAKPSQSWLWYNSKRTITSAYDTRTLVLFISKIIHPKQTDSNTSSYNNPIFIISDTGSPTQSNGSSNGGLRIVSMRHFTKRTASVRSHGALVEWEALVYTTTHSNHMLITTLKINTTRYNINKPFGVARTSVYARFAWYLG